VFGGLYGAPPRARHRRVPKAFMHRPTVSKAARQRVGTIGGYVLGPAALIDFGAATSRVYLHKKTSLPRARSPDPPLKQSQAERRTVIHERAATLKRRLDEAGSGDAEPRHIVP